ncbi:MAG: hypothetical protein JW754_04825 [Candidatus Aenigmarchaeota archaeon]|nr:hypothetical protein [Candidatus Aenigmarchaeota archaeon]
MGRELFGYKAFQHHYNTGQIRSSHIEVCFSQWYKFLITEDGLLTDTNGKNPRKPEDVIGSRKWREL